MNSNASLTRPYTGRTRALRVIEMDDETLSSSSPLVGGNYPPNQTLHSGSPQEIGSAGTSDLLRFCCVVPWLFWMSTAARVELSRDYDGIFRSEPR